MSTNNNNSDHNKKRFRVDDNNNNNNNDINNNNTSNNNNINNNNINPSPANNPPPPKRSRWGGKVIDPNNTIANNNNNNNISNTNNSEYKLSNVVLPVPNNITTSTHIPSIPMVSSNPDMFINVNSSNVDNQQEFVQLTIKINNLTSLINGSKPLIIPDNQGNRSPSPEPVYDNLTGKRINTRENRFKKKLEGERNSLIQRCLLLNPKYKPPIGYKPQIIKYEKKIYVPIHQHPNYNFRGQIIGPRGTTQKKLEKELSCKIVLRGKGSVLEGKQARPSGKVEPGDFEDLHVLITAVSQEKLDAATKVIEKLLVPVEDSTNEHKSQQLRELALYNGTLREPNNVICRSCGEPGHKINNCPRRETAGVKCKLCAAENHITKDCPNKQKIHNNNQNLYDNFMAEITGNKPNTTSTNHNNNSTKPTSSAVNDSAINKFIPANNSANSTQYTNYYPNNTYLQQQSQSTSHNDNNSYYHNQPHNNSLYYQDNYNQTYYTQQSQTIQSHNPYHNYANTQQQQQQQHNIYTQHPYYYNHNQPNTNVSSVPPTATNPLPSSYYNTHTNTYPTTLPHTNPHNPTPTIDYSVYPQQY